MDAPSLREVVDLVHDWYPVESAEEWDAVGLAHGRSAHPVTRILLAVDPVQAVADEAAQWGADLLVTHHPLFLRGVHGFTDDTTKGRVVLTLADAGCALLTAHTNADVAVGGVSESLALTLGLTDLEALSPAGAEVGHGRVGTVAPTTLGAFAQQVAAALPSTGAGSVRVAGDRDRPVGTVALCGGAGDAFMAEALASGADVYVTSDLRHHVVSEFLAEGGAVIDVPHWAAEWTWLPVLASRLDDALGARVEIRISEIVTDPWTARI